MDNQSATINTSPVKNLEAMKKLFDSIDQGTEVYIGKTVKGFWSIRGLEVQVVDQNFDVALTKFLEESKKIKPITCFSGRKTKITIEQLG